MESQDTLVGSHNSKGDRKKGSGELNTWLEACCGDRGWWSSSWSTSGFIYGPLWRMIGSSDGLLPAFYSSLCHDG